MFGWATYSTAGIGRLGLNSARLGHSSLYFIYGAKNDHKKYASTSALRSEQPSASTTKINKIWINLQEMDYQKG